MSDRGSGCKADLAVFATRSLGASFINLLSTMPDAPCWELQSPAPHTA